MLITVGVTSIAWRAPSDFPLTSASFWSSTGVVLASWLLVLLAALAAWRGWTALLVALLLVPGGALLAVGITGRLVFPWSLRLAWAIPFVLGVTWTLGLVRTLRRLEGRARLAWAGLLPGALAGVALVLARVPPPAATHPALAQWADWTGAADLDAVPVPCGHATLELSPLLAFQRTSRDGFFPGLSAPEPMTGRRAFTVGPVDGGVALEARSEVPRAVFSHLNRFAEARVTGLSAPALRFSPTGDARFDVTVFDYPWGRPARFAYRTADGRFVVAEGTSAEKGPFRPLAQARLGATDALTVTLLDGVEPQCALTFFDFARQADTTPSPTAGEGVPVNVVQFGRAAATPDVTWLHLSLAETGIGSGLDAVAHAPGVYVNRVRIEPR